jgi:hypothetical protein
VAPASLPCRAPPHEAAAGSPPISAHPHTVHSSP